MIIKFVALSSVPSWAYIIKLIKHDVSIDKSCEKRLWLLSSDICLLFCLKLFISSCFILNIDVIVLLWQSNMIHILQFVPPHILLRLPLYNTGKCTFSIDFIVKKETLRRLTSRNVIKTSQISSVITNDVSSWTHKLEKQWIPADWSTKVLHCFS